MTNLGRARWSVLGGLAASLAAGVAGCGGDGRTSDEPDAEQRSDARPEVDAGCDKPVVFINTLQGGPEDYLPGGDSAGTNHSTLLTEAATLGPMAATDTAEIVAGVRAVLEPLGIEVTEDDPGLQPQLEVVLVGSGWPLESNVLSIAPDRCEPRSDVIGLVNGTIGAQLASLAGSVLVVTGLLNGLEFTWEPDNCMFYGARVPCTFADGLLIEKPRCDGTIDDQLAVLQTALACP